MQLQTESLEPRFLLASGSPRRRQLLETLGIPFQVVANPWEEVSRAGESARHQVRRLSQEKMHHFLDSNPQNLLPVLTADTLLSFRGRPLGKPSSADEAWGFYQQLAGHSHQVLTSICLWLPNRQTILQQTVATTVEFIRWDKELYRLYLERGEWQDAAGGYKIQETGEMLVKRIRGSWSNVVGLPIAEIYGMLRPYLSGVRS